MSDYRAKVSISAEYIKASLGLPEGSTIRDIVYDNDRNLYTIYIMSGIEIPGVPFCPEGQEPQSIDLPSKDI